MSSGNDGNAILNIIPTLVSVFYYTWGQTLPSIKRERERESVCV